MKILILLLVVTSVLAEDSNKKDNKAGKRDLFELGYGFEPHHSVTITKEVKVPVFHPYPVHVEKKVHVPVHVEKPYPVYIEKKVPYPVVKHVAYPVKVPVAVPKPYPVKVAVPQPYPVKVSVIVEKKVPILVKDHHSESYSGYEHFDFGHK